MTESSGVSAPPSRQLGAIIIWFAFVLVLSLGFIGLGIDVAKLDATRTQLQNAADGAALAGVSGINPTTGIIDPITATARAQQTASMNKAFVDVPETVTLDANDVTVLSGNRVKVTVRREGSNSVVAHVAQVLGIAKLQMTATATAQAQEVSIAQCGIVPLAVQPNPPGSTFQTGCGQNYRLKAPGGSGTNGNYGGLDLSECAAGANCGNGGAARWRCLMANGYCCDLSIGDVVNVKTGNMSGPAQTAITDRFNADVVRTQGICYSDYLAAGGNGRRVVGVPVTTPFPNGSGTVTITGFAFFFLKNIPASGNASTIDGEFVYSVIPGVGGGSGAGPFALSVHLVPNGP